MWNWSENAESDSFTLMITLQCSELRVHPASDTHMFDAEHAIF